MLKVVKKRFPGAIQTAQLPTTVEDEAIETVNPPTEPETRQTRPGTAEELYEIRFRFLMENSQKVWMPEHTNESS